jgi:hypothetical protein
MSDFDFGPSARAMKTGGPPTAPRELESDTDYEDGKPPVILLVMWTIVFISTASIWLLLLGPVGRVLMGFPLSFILWNWISSFRSLAPHRFASPASRKSRPNEDVVELPGMVDEVEDVPMASDEEPIGLPLVTPDSEERKPPVVQRDKGGSPVDAPRSVSTVKKLDPESARFVQFIRDAARLWDSGAIDETALLKESLRSVEKLGGLVKALDKMID